MIATENTSLCKKMETENAMKWQDMATENVTRCSDQLMGVGGACPTTSESKKLIPLNFAQMDDDRTLHDGDREQCHMMVIGEREHHKNSDIATNV